MGISDSSESTLNIVMPMPVSKEETMKRLTIALLLVVMVLPMAFAQGVAESAAKPVEWSGVERQITDAPTGHILTNLNVFSPDSKWIVFDERSDADGAVFDSSVIRQVNIETGEVQTLYTSKNGAFVGVVTYNQSKDQVVFIHGPENPTPDWSYGGSHRSGTIVNVAKPGLGINLDARDLTAPFTPGALRGGSHVHVYEPSGEWLAFTYQDAVLGALGSKGNHDLDQRNVGVSVPVQAVSVEMDGSRNRSGSTFTFLATRTVNAPKPGSDEINRAYEDGWLGNNGYIKADGTRQRHAIAFLGDTLDKDGKKLSEVFIVDLPEDVRVASEDGPLEGTATKMPRPPKGTQQRRLTFTADRAYPGVTGPRFFVRASPDGEKIAFLLKDDAGIGQIFTVSPEGGEYSQVTSNAFPVQSAFSWSPDSSLIAYAGNNGMQITEVASGKTWQVAPSSAEAPVQALAAVFSPDGKRIAYQRRIMMGTTPYNQIFVTELSK